MKKNEWNVYAVTYMRKDVKVTELRFMKVLTDELGYEYLGIVDTEFPVEYPLVLTNGLIIQVGDYYRESKTDDGLITSIDK